VVLCWPDGPRGRHFQACAPGFLLVDMDVSGRELLQLDAVGSRSQFGLGDDVRVGARSVVGRL
jgi:hypothetical protein